MKGWIIMHYIVFLDTNIFDSNNYKFNNELFTKLSDYTDKGIIELQISSVVKGEVSRHIKDKVKDKVEEYNKTITSRDFKIFENDPEYSKLLIKYDADAWVDKALQIFNDYLNKCKTTILTADEINTESILYNYFNCQAPFEKAKKDEFPDAISLEVISKEISRLSKGKVFSNYINASGTPDDMLYCIISRDEGFRKAAEGIASDRPNEDVVVFESMHKLFKSITTQDERAKNLQDQLNQGFAKEIIEETIMQASENAAYIIDEDDGYVDDYTFEQADNIQYETDVISYQQMSDGSAVARVFVNMLFDARIEYEFLNANESFWDKEDQAFMFSVITKKNAVFQVESNLIFTLKIDSNQNAEFLEYIETPSDIDIQSNDIINIISCENKYPF